MSDELKKKIDKVIHEMETLKNELYIIKEELEKNKRINNISSCENDTIINKSSYVMKENIVMEEESQNDIKMITNIDLNYNQYDEKTLSYNMEKGTLCPYSVLKTQKDLSNEFIVEYILNEKYAVFREDYDITINKIIGLFPNFAYFDPKKYHKTKKI